MTLSQMKKQNAPIADLKTVQEWFEKAANNADSQGKSDSAALWRDGLAHLNSLTCQRDELLEEISDFVLDHDNGLVPDIERLRQNTQQEGL